MKVNQELNLLHSIFNQPFDQHKFNRVMVNMVGTSRVDRGFESRSNKK